MLRPCFLIVTVLFTGSALGGEKLYLALAGEAKIDVYDIDAGSGDLKLAQTLKTPGGPGAMAFSPDGKHIYVALAARRDGKNVAEVATLSRSDDGKIKFVSKAKILVRPPYIRATKDGRFLLAAHYGTGEVTIYAIKNGICTDEMVDHHKTYRTAHCIEIDPTGDYVYVPHTEPNRVYQFRLNKQSGKITALDPPYVTGPDEDHLYHQPRHIANHPKLNMAYTSNERGGGISVWSRDTKTGKLTLKQTLTSLPPGTDGKSAAADIKVTPDGRFVYVSNRDLNKREDNKGNDTLAGYAIDGKTGRVKPIGLFPTEHFPRTFCVNSTGEFVYAGGQKSNHLQAYRIAKDGALKPLKRYDVGKVPIWAMTK